MPSPPVHLELLPVPVDPESWRRACKTGLGLGPRDADRLAAARPISLRAFADRSVHNLGGVVRPALQGGDPCTDHPQIVAGERCPRCETYRACPVCLLQPEPGCARCSGRRRFWGRFKAVRVAVLLAVLGLVAWNSWSAERRLRSWAGPVTVGVYPVDAAADPAVARFTRGLTDASFAPVAEFLGAQGQRHGRSVGSLVQVRVYPPLVEQPPPSPPPGQSALHAVRWSLALRWWAFQTKRRHGLPASDVELYVRFHPPRAHPDLDLSVAVPQGQLGVVETVADRESMEWTLLATTHELLHTLGAPDTYDAEGLPLDPEGLAEPERGYPQRLCEIMSGQIALSPEKARPAQSLSECRVGASTARAIGWR